MPVFEARLDPSGIIKGAYEGEKAVAKLSNSLDQLQSSSKNALPSTSQAAASSSGLIQVAKSANLTQRGVSSIQNSVSRLGVAMSRGNAVSSESVNVLARNNRIGY